MFYHSACVTVLLFFKNQNGRNVFSKTFIQLIIKTVFEIIYITLFNSEYFFYFYIHDYLLKEKVYGTVRPFPGTR